MLVVVSHTRLNSGDIGENITTRDLDILSLPQRTRLKVGSEAIVRVTGLRNPCVQIETFQKGLLEKCLRRENGKLVRKAGIMSVVEVGGIVRPGDAIQVIFPEGEQKSLEVV